MNIKNTIKHFNKINKHRYCVCKNCFKAGIYKRGLLHDLSKYSPTEFFESVKYYQGNSSPIEKCKKEKGYSKAWLHHRSHNLHHWEYWIDNINNGYPEAIAMPYEYLVEMLCDYIGAGQVYSSNWSPQQEYDWWKNKRTQVLMHPITYDFIESILYWMAMDGDYKKFLNKEFLKSLYAVVSFKYKNLPNHYRIEIEK